MMKKKGTVKRGIALFVTVATILVSASTILAYEPFAPVDEGTMEEISYGDFGAFSSEEDNIRLDTGECDFSISDSIFICEDGTTLAIADETSPKVLCNHIMVDGYYNVHKSNSTGGCTVTVYDAQKCSRCGYLKLGSVYATTTYTVCPH